MENNLIKSIVYLTINLINFHIYIGVHDIDENDSKNIYLGNGVRMFSPKTYMHPKEPFQFAVKKYGPKNFRRITLAEFDNRKEALWLEGILVNDKFLARDDVYNIARGGGDPPRLTKAVYKYDLNGNFLSEYESIVEAGHLNNIDPTAISNAVIYKTVSANCFWTEYLTSKIDLTEYKNTTQSRKIYSYSESGEFIKEYACIMDAVREFNTSLGVIQRAIKSQTKVHNTYFSFEKLESFKKKITQRHYNDPIHQYALNGTYIKTFNSIGDVVKQLGKTYQGISNSITTQSTCGGFQWSWEKIERMPNKETVLSKARRVGQFTLDGELVKVYDTVRDCRKDFGNVSRVLKGLVKTCKGFTFKYVD